MLSQKFTINETGYLLKYIPLTTKNQYLKNMTDKVENFVKRL